MNEWSLYIFSLALQGAIGGTIVLLILNYLLKGNEKMKQINKIALSIFSVFAVIGLIASFTHLGTPANALNAINNLAGSWMSREIVFTSLFIALIIATLALTIIKKAINMPLLIITAIVGFVDVYAMAQIYFVTIFTDWNTLATIVGFYGSALVLGATLTGLIAMPILKEEGVGIASVIIAIGVIGALIEIIAVAIFGGATVGESIAFARWCLLGLGVAMLAIPILNKNTNVIYIAFVILIAAEAVGRYGFYAVAG